MSVLLRDSGIVLATERRGETSLSAIFLGRHAGKLRLLAKGALSARHPSRGALEPGNEVEVLYYQRDGQVTCYLKEISLMRSPGAGRDSLPHLAANLAALELLNHVCVPQASIDTDVVDTVSAFLATPPAVDPLFLFLAFQIKLLGALGVSPDTFDCVRCGESPGDGIYSPRDGVSFCAEHRTAVPEAVRLSPEIVAAAGQCAQESFELLAREGVARTVRKELGRLVHWTYTYHVQGYHLPRSLNLI
jgi:DNA repair protein RecO